MDKAGHDVHYIIIATLLFESTALAIPVSIIPKFMSNHESPDKRAQASKSPAMSNEAPTNSSKKFQEKRARLIQSTDSVVNLDPDTFRHDLM